MSLEYYFLKWRRAWAECTPWSNFLFPSGSAIWVSPALNTFAQNPEQNWATDVENAWWGDAATMLSSVGGQWYGFGEWVQVLQSTNGFGPSTIWAHEETGGQGYISASYYSIFVGIPNSGRLVRLIGYQGGAYGLSDATHADTEFAVSTLSGYSSYWISPIDRAICYISMASGNFVNYAFDFADGVRISNTSNWWLLAVTHGYQGTAQARARCMAYDQR
jgi:hypothetical protein